MARPRTSYLTWIVFVLALGWTVTDESSNPLLTPGELPAAMAGCLLEPCAGDPDYLINWFARSPKGNLFLVTPATCNKSDCASWLVEKSSDQVMPLFYLLGRYKLVPGEHGYPDVQLRRDLSATEIDFSQFTWRAGRYVQTADERRYRVDGEECGTREECNAVALHALRNQHPEQALKIWETVQGVSWI